MREILVIAYSDPHQTHEIGRAEVDPDKGFLHTLPEIPVGGSLAVQRTESSRIPTNPKEGK